MRQCSSLKKLSSLPSFRSVQKLGCCLASALALALVGCGEGKSSVSGTVTFDGEPVKNGSITFVKSEGELVREGDVISDGTFQVSLPPGEYKIELNAQKVVSRRKQKGFDGKDEEVEITDELFPERYNTKTELTTKINPGPNVVKLDAKGAK